jgi:CheY-like chemotaxis protein
MARLLIVSRSMALAMRLADQHEVIEHPVDELDSLLPNLDADVLVLDLGDPVLAVNTVNSLREAERDTPVLLVSGYQPEWEQVEAQQVEGVHVVPLPITRVALLHGIALLTGEDSPINFVNSEDVESLILPDDPAYGYGLDELEEPDGEPGPNGVAHDVEEYDQAEYDQAEYELEEYELEEYEPEQYDGPFEDQPSGAPVQEQPHWAEPSQQDPAVGWGDPQNGAEVAAVTESDVAGLSYSTSLTRPFDEEPRTGQIPVDSPTPRPPSAAQRWLRTTAAPAPDPDNLGEPRHGNTNGNGVGRRIPRLGNRPRKLQRHPGTANGVEQARAQPGIGLVTDPLGPRTDPYGFPASALDRRLDAEAASLVTDRAAVESGISLRTADLVRMLHERAGDLYGVSDTAQVLADDVIERADADAAAILVPDGPIWRVSGGVGLRPLERRLVLEDAHWLITEIGSAGRAVLIEDTDIIRQQLSGAPLAAWRHLLAVPVPDVRAIVVLARGQEGGPFTDRDLSAVIAPVREAAALLSQAVETRRLARMLGPLREADGDTPFRRPAEH